MDQFSKPLTPSLFCSNNISTPSPESAPAPQKTTTPTLHFNKRRGNGHRRSGQPQQAIERLAQVPRLQPEVRNSVSERQLYYYYYYLKNLLFLSVNLLFLYIIETHFSLCVILLFTINDLNNQLVFRKLEIIKVIKKICLK